MVLLMHVHHAHNLASGWDNSAYSNASIRRDVAPIGCALVRHAGERWDRVATSCRRTCCSWTMPTPPGCCGSSSPGGRASAMTSRRKRWRCSRTWDRNAYSNASICQDMTTIGCVFAGRAGAHAHRPWIFKRKEVPSSQPRIFKCKEIPSSQQAHELLTKRLGSLQRWWFSVVRAPFCAQEPEKFPTVFEMDTNDASRCGTKMPIVRESTRKR